MDVTENAQQEQVKANYLDPFIISKPTLSVPHIADIYQDDTGIGGVKYNRTLEAGILYPLIKYNGTNVPAEHILKMRLSSVDVVPELYLEISDPSKIYRSIFDIKAETKIDVIFTADVDGLWRKVALSFMVKMTKPEKTKDEPGYEVNPYAIDMESNSSFICLHGTYDMLDLHHQHPRTLITSKGLWDKRNDEKTYEDAKFELSCFETLQALAEEYELGLAVTPMCKEIEDVQPRFLHGTLYDYLKNIKKYSGIDENSVFDCWIDVYNYLTMSNITYLLNKDVSIDELETNAITGLDVELDALQHKAITGYIPRIITNDKRFVSKNNLYCVYCDVISNYSKNINEGTLNTIYANTTGGNNNNTLDKKELASPMNTTTAKTNATKYEVNKTVVLDPDYGPTNTKMQREIVNAVKRKHKAKIYKFSLAKLNLGLLRGMLIGVQWYHTNSAASLMAVRQAKNIHPLTRLSFDLDENVIYNDDTEQDLNNQITTSVDDVNTWVPDYSKTGVYYILGIEYLYMYDTFYQNLYCIRHTPVPDMEPDFKLTIEE